MDEVSGGGHPAVDSVRLLVNGTEHVVDCSSDTPLLYVLRNDLGLMGTRFGCGLGLCGACNVLVDGRPREIIGVLPARFRFLDLKPALFLPLQKDRSKTYLGNFSYSAIARLKPGFTIAQARADVARRWLCEIFPHSRAIPPKCSMRRGLVPACDY